MKKSDILLIIFLFISGALIFIFLNGKISNNLISLIILIFGSSITLVNRFISRSKKSNDK